MKKINIYKDIEGIEYPAGRKGRVFVGVNSPLKAKDYVIGTSDIYANGSVPEHNHETEETYIIIKGRARVIVDGEETEASDGDVFLMKPWVRHAIHNIGNDTLRIMYVYSPAIVVDHWKKELEGKL